MLDQIILIISLSLITGILLGAIIEKYYGFANLLEKVGLRSVAKEIIDKISGKLPVEREEVDCNQLNRNNLMVALVFGQSNSANEGESPKTAKRNVYSFYKGKCYRAKDPLLGASGEGGSVWTRLGDRIIEENLYNQVLFVPIGVGGTQIARWKPDGDLHKRILESIKDLKKHNLTLTHMLWHQGEMDAVLNTSKEEYKKMFLDMLESIRANGIDAPIYVSIATRCNRIRENKDIQQAQRELVDILKKIYPGPDTDKLGLEYRFDGCHFSDEGLGKYAELWLEKLKIRY